MQIKINNGKYFYENHELFCKYFDENHQYFLGYEENGEFIKVKELISVTTLLAKHGLSANYSGVNQEILKRKAERGNLIHEELEKYVLSGEIGFTQELLEFMQLCSAENIKPQKAEFIVYNDVVAGTVDTAGLINNFTYMGDFKTTAKYYENSVAWQLSIYEYLSGKFFDKLLCFHFNDGLSLKIVDRVDRKLVEDLIEKERNGEIYQTMDVMLTESVESQLIYIQKELKSLSDRKKELEEKEQIIKQTILESMRETRTKSIENDFFKITYVAESERRTIDSTKLKQEMPEIAEKYTKITVIPPNLRITVKEG